METGELCVMMDGQLLMPMWPADSLDILALVGDSYQNYCMHSKFKFAICT